METADQSCRVTVVGSRRRVDVTLPSRVPVAALLWDVVEMLGEADGSVPASWMLVRVGGHVLDPELDLSAQDVASGTMLFLRDVTTQDPPPAVDDYAVGVAIAVDAQGGRWTRDSAPPLLAAGAAACLATAGLVLLLSGDREIRTVFGLGGAAVAAVAGLAMSQRLRRRSSGGLIALSAVPLWAAAAAGLAGLANAGPAAILASLLGSIGVGAAIAVLVAGDVVLVPAVGVISATLVPALVLGGCAVVGGGPVAAAALLCPVALGGLALASRLAVRLAGVDNAAAGSISTRAAQARRLLAAMLSGLAVVLIASSAILALSGGRFAWGLVAAAALAVIAKARHFRFAAEVAPLLAAGLTGLLLIEYPLLVAVGGLKSAGVAAAVLTVDALVLALAGSTARRWDLSTQARLQLGRLESIATAATVPLAAGVLGVYAEVARLAHGFS